MSKFTKIVISFTLLVLSTSTVFATPALVSFDSDLGKTLLLRSANEEYFQLSMQFLTQKNQAYCGIASMTILLNALGVQGPADSVYAPYRPVTQDNIFTPAVRKIMSPEAVATHGLTLDQAAAMLATFPVKVEIIHSDVLTLEKMRALLTTAINEHKQYVIVNYLRTGLNQKGSGHFSPLAAYDAKTDRFLILDVARYKEPPIWVTAAELWQAINTLDSTSQKQRGLILVSKLEVTKQ